jgi:hypothetical protein
VYRVTILTRDEWTRGPGTPPVVIGLVYRWVQDCGGDWGWAVWQSVGRRHSIYLGKYATVLQAELYVILDCVH